MQKRKILKKVIFFTLLFFVIALNMRTLFGSAEDSPTSKGDDTDLKAKKGTKAAGLINFSNDEFNEQVVQTTISTLQPTQGGLKDDFNHVNNKRGDIITAKPYKKIANPARDYFANYPLPSNFSLVKEHEVVLILGRADIGKTTLVNGFAGYSLESNLQKKIDVEETKCPEPEDFKHALEEKSDEPVMQESNHVCPKIANIFLNEEKKWVFVDCAGFDDQRPQTQRLFNEASLQIIVNKINKLRAVLCIMEMAKFQQKIKTLQDMENHDLCKLVQYLQQILKAPFISCAEHLLLVISKTQSEYRLINVEETLQKHYESLLKLKLRFLYKKEEWAQKGQPILDFLTVFIINKDKEQMMSIANITGLDSFKLAIHKITKIKRPLVGNSFKMNLSRQTQEQFKPIILRQSKPIKQLQEMYNLCKERLTESAKNDYENFKKDHASLKRIGYSSSALGAGLGVWSFFDKKRSPLLKIAAVGNLFVAGSIAFSYKYMEKKYLPNAPIEKAIKEATLTLLKKEELNLRQAEFYYELISLGAVLLHDPVFKLFKDTFEQEFKKEII